MKLGLAGLGAGALCIALVGVLPLLGTGCTFGSEPGAASDGDAAARPGSPTNVDGFDSKINHLEEDVRHLVADYDDADEAFKEFNKAVANRRQDDAIIYGLSAVSRRPNYFPYLKAYADYALQVAKSPSDWDRLRTVLDVQLCHVPTKDIAAVRRLIEQVEKERSKAASIEGPSPTLPTQKPDWPGRLKLLTEPPLEKLYEDDAKLQKRTSDLQELTEAMENDPDPAVREVLPKARQEFRVATDLIIVHRQVVCLRLCMGKLRTLREQRVLGQESAMAISLVQAAENALAPLWAIDFSALHGVNSASTLPAAITKEITQIAADLPGWADEIAKARSSELLPKVEQLLGDSRKVTGTQNEPLEPKCAELGQKLREAQSVVATMSSAAVAAEGGRMLAEMQNLLIQMRREQSDRYQNAALGVLEGVINRLEAVGLGSVIWSKMPFTPSHDEILKGIFHTPIEGNPDRTLPRIDESLLTRETGRVYSQLLDRILAAVTPRVAFELQREIFEEKGKMKLEEF